MNYRIIRPVIAVLISISMVITGMVAFADETINSNNNDATVSDTEADKKIEGNEGKLEENEVNEEDKEGKAENNDNAVNDNSDNNLSVVQPNMERTNDATPNLAAADDGTGLVLKQVPREKNDDGTPKFTYYSGHSIDVFNHVEASGDNTDLINPYVIVSIPKKNISDMPTVSTAVSLESATVEDNAAANTWDIKFVYKRLTGGDVVSVPFSFHHDNYDTPKGFTTTIKSTFYKADGTKLLETSENYVADIVPMNFIKSKDPNMEEQFGGLPKPGSPNLVDPDRTTPVKFTFSTNNYGQSGTGLGIYSEPMRLFEVLPQGSRFLPEHSGNSGWTYDAATNSVYRDIPKHNNTFAIYYIYLDFPNAPFNTAMENKGVLSRPDADGSLPTSPRSTDMTSTTDFKLVTSTFGDLKKEETSHMTRWYVPNERDKVHEWRLKLTPRFADTVVNITEIEDYLTENISKHLEYVKFNLKLPDSMTLGSNRLLGYTADNTEEVIATNISANTEYPVDKKYRRIVLKLTTPLAVSTKEQAEEILPHVYTKLNSDSWDDKLVIGSHRNYAKMTIESGGVEQTITSVDSITIYEYDPRLYIKSSATPTCYVDEVGDVKFDTDMENVAILGEKMEKPKYVVLLPQIGVHYVPGSFKFMGETVMPLLVENYKESGRPALIYQHPDNVEFTPFNKPSIEFQVKYNRNAVEGPNDFDCYTTIKNGTETWNWKVDSSGEDKYDVDGDGAVDDSVGYKVATTNYVPPKELIGTVLVERTDGTFAENRDAVEIGGNLKYKIGLENKSLVDITNINLVSVLPKPGDKSIVTDLQGNYLPRGSEFAVALTGPMTPPEGFTITYSTETPGTNAADINAQNFKAAGEITDWSKVTMFKMVMNQGKILKPGESSYLEYSVKADDNSALEEGMVANNSFAYSTTANNFIESSYASATLVKYNVNGTMFYDKNKNGVMDPEDYPLKDYEFTLIKKDDNTEIKAKTDKDGKYAIVVLRAGDYKIKLTKGENEEVTIIGTGNGVVNHLDATGLKDGITLSSTNKTATVNGGIVKTKGTVEITKTDENGNPLANVVFELLDTVENKVVILTTDANGKASFENLVFDRKYKLIEKTAPDGFVVPKTETEVITTAENLINNLNIVNKLIRAHIEVTVVDKNDHNIRLEGSKVKLQKFDKDGNPEGDPIEKITDKEGKVFFENTPFGNYKIVQITTIDDYILNDVPVDARVENDGETVRKIIENIKVKTPPKEPKKPGKPVDSGEGGKISKASKTVNTGDEFNYRLPVIVMLASLSLITSLVLIYLIRRQKTIK